MFKNNMVMWEFTKCLLGLKIGLWGLVCRYFYPSKMQSKIMRKKNIDIVSKNKEKTTTMTAFKHAHKTIISFSQHKVN